jgi:hypothetical protein
MKTDRPVRRKSVRRILMFRPCISSYVLSTLAMRAYRILACNVAARPATVGPAMDDNFLLSRPYHSEHGPKIPFTGPEVHPFAAGAAKTGVYVIPN